jgi:hypothetical protein
VTPRRLPVVRLEGVEYFFDSRISQLRNVRNPHEFIDLSPIERKYFIEATIHRELAASRVFPSLGTGTKTIDHAMGQGSKP